MQGPHPLRNRRESDVAHPLTAPVRPPTIRRSNRLKNTSAGIIDSDVKASTFAVSTEYCDEKACTPERQGEVRLVVQDEQRQQVAVPASDEGEDADGDDTGHREREHHPPEERQAAASVDVGGLLDLVGDRSQERDQDDDRRRQRERDLRQDDAPAACS